MDADEKLNDSGEDRSVSTSVAPEAEENNDASPANADVSEQSDEGSPEERLRAERDKYKEQLLRTAADFDNFRKRSLRELHQSQLKGKEEALREILPVIDNLERAMEAAESSSDLASFLDGMKMVLKLFDDSAAKLDLKRIETVGKGFDPNVHEALQQQESAEHPAGTILSEIQAGYTLGGRVLRAAMVVVAKPPAAQSNENNQSDDEEEQTG